MPLEAFPALKTEDTMSEFLEYTAEVRKTTDPLYPRVEKIIPEIEWPTIAPYVHAINTLKAERNAVVLAHNYMVPTIFHLVADKVGDSLQLALEAAKTEARIIVQGGVYFMAETSKILSPDKIVLIPDPEAGCSLSESITAADVQRLREQYPGLPVVTYVNTSAEVKAASDICCTSSNAIEVVEHIAAEWGVDSVIMTPDQFLARNVAQQTSIKVIAYDGSCMVHKLFTADHIQMLRQENPGIIILSHPECTEDVVAKSDFAGSTAAMHNYISKEHPAKVALITECSMGANLTAEFPDTQIIRPCMLCPHMHKITLPGILKSLQTMTYEVTVADDVIAGARRAIENMLLVKTSNIVRNYALQ